METKAAGVRESAERQSSWAVGADEGDMIAPCHCASPHSGDSYLGMQGAPVGDQRWRRVTAPSSSP
jgi:hypothetical protein